MRFALDETIDDDDEEAVERSMKEGNDVKFNVGIMGLLSPFYHQQRQLIDKEIVVTA